MNYNRTDNGFYIGDVVRYKKGDRELQTRITKIHSIGKWSWVETGKLYDYMKVPCSIIELADGTITTDLKVWRVR